MKMLNIKNVRPKTKQKAIYVTKDNIKEFLEYAYPDKYDIDSLKLDNPRIPLCATVECTDSSSEPENFRLDKWYVSLFGGDYACCEDEYFITTYDIED